MGRPPALLPPLASASNTTLHIMRSAVSLTVHFESTDSIRGCVLNALQSARSLRCRFDICVCISSRNSTFTVELSSFGIGPKILSGVHARYYSNNIWMKIFNGI